MLPSCPYNHAIEKGVCACVHTTPPHTWKGSISPQQEGTRAKYTQNGGVCMVHLHVLADGGACGLLADIVVATQAHQRDGLMQVAHHRLCKTTRNMRASKTSMCPRCGVTQQVGDPSVVSEEKIRGVLAEVVRGVRARP